MKQLFKGGLQIAFLSLIFLNSILSYASDASNTGDEYLSIGTTSVSVEIFTKVVQDLHKDGNAQGTLRDKEFLKAFATLTQKKNQHPLISMMTQETKDYLQANLFSLLPMVSGQESAALKILGALGEYETEELKENLKGMALLEQKWTQEEREGIIAEGHGTALETLFPQFYAHEIAPAPNAPFLQRWFWEQKGNVTKISTVLSAQQVTLQTAQKSGDSEAIQAAMATVLFWQMHHYAATHPLDHTLEKGFPDAQLFIFSDDYTQLDLSRYFLTAAVARDQKTLSAFESQFYAAEGDAVAQQNILLDADTWMLKVEMMSLGTMVLNDIIKKGTEDPQEFHNLNVHLGNLFLKYIRNFKILDTSLLPYAHAELRLIKSRYDTIRDDLQDNPFEIPKLLSTQDVIDISKTSLEEFQKRIDPQRINQAAEKSIAASLGIIGDVKKGTDAQALQNQDEGALKESTLLGRMEDLGKRSLTEKDPVKLQEILQALQELLKEAKS